MAIFMAYNFNTGCWKLARRIAGLPASVGCWKQRSRAEATHLQLCRHILVTRLRRGIFLVTIFVSESVLRDFFYCLFCLGFVLKLSYKCCILLCILNAGDLSSDTERIDSFMSASRNKKERKLEVDSLTQKKQEAQVVAAKAKRKSILYIVIGVLVAILIAALLFWDSGFIQKRATAATIGDNEYKVVDLDYFFYSTLNGYGNNAEAYGLDLKKPLDEQEAYDGYTWQDVLTDNALTSLNSVAVLANQAREAGYELSEKGQDDVQKALQNAEAYATIYGSSVEQFLKATYGKYMTIEDYTRILTEIQLAGEYGSKITEDMDVSEEEINAFYQEHTADLDTIDYNCYLVPFETTTKDPDQGEVPLDAETIESNRQQAEAHAQEILNALVAGNAIEAKKLAETYGAVDNSNKLGISYSGYADWMADAAHKAGSYGLVENKHASTNEVIGYFAIYVNDRKLDQYNGANLRVLRIGATSDQEGNFDMADCKTRAEKVLAEFEATDKSSDSFVQIYNGASADLNYPGGLRENVSKRQFNEAMTQWIFDAGRVQGDYQLFESTEDNSYYLVYFEGMSDLPYWKSVSIANVQQTKYSEWLDEQLKANPIEKASGLKYIG